MHPDTELSRRLAFARERDAADPLRRFRAEFALPHDAAGAPLAYLCGHSLGLAPQAARAAVATEIADWERLGVLGHEQAGTPWIDYAETLGEPLATLTGAGTAEVIAMNSLTVNLHLLLARFYRPAGPRTAILIESGAFSSDRHAVASQIAWRGLDISRQLLELAPDDGDLLTMEQIEAQIAGNAERLALILWPAVQYRTGQRFDVARLVRAAHAAGCPIGFDLAHAIGNVPLSLHADGADFAVWCSYKYLNGGPGAIGGAFVHERHLAAGPALTGWWGHERASRFALASRFTPTREASAFALSNPPILSAAPLKASLPLFSAAGVAALREKSLGLTGYLESLLAELAGSELSPVTPADPEQRGCQLSMRVRDVPKARGALRELAGRAAVCDWRAPDIVRLAPVPLYNSYEDVLIGATQLAHALRAA